VILKQFKPEILPVAIIASVVCVTALVADELKDMLSEFRLLVDNTELLADGYTDILLKVLLTAVVSKLSSDFSRDNGFSVFASTIELLGKILMLSFSFPVIKVIVELVQGLLV
jgi:stage III sporulation protein AD